MRVIAGNLILAVIASLLAITFRNSHWRWLPILLWVLAIGWVVNAAWKIITHG